jgi:hypothetical protein
VRHQGRLRTRVNDGIEPTRYRSGRIANDPGVPNLVKQFSGAEITE